MVGLEAPAAGDHGSLFHHGSHRDPGHVAVGLIAPPQARSLPVHKALTKKVVVFLANSMGVIVRVLGLAVQVEKIAPEVEYM